MIHSLTEGDALPPLRSLVPVDCVRAQTPLQEERVLDDNAQVIVADRLPEHEVEAAVIVGDVVLAHYLPERPHRVDVEVEQGHQWDERPEQAVEVDVVEPGGILWRKKNIIILVIKVLLQKMRIYL